MLVLNSELWAELSRRSGRVPSRTLTEQDAAIARALLLAGWQQHDIASLLGCNQGRIAEVAGGERFPGIPAADLKDASVRAYFAILQNNWTLRIARQLALILSPSGAMI